MEARPHARDEAQPALAIAAYVSQGHSMVVLFRASLPVRSLFLCFSLFPDLLIGWEGACARAGEETHSKELPS